MTEQTPSPRKRLSSVNPFILFVVLLLVFFLVRYLGSDSDGSESAPEEQSAAQQAQAEVDLADDETSSADEETTADAPDVAGNEDADETASETADAQPASSSADNSTSAPRAPPGMATITLDELPPEALETIALIESGGPFPYDKDGSTFQNREGLLPDQPMGYYAEYTVETPRSSDRGARRIVGGSAGELYYTDDHYASFSWIKLE